MNTHISNRTSVDMRGHEYRLSCDVMLIPDNIGQFPQFIGETVCNVFARSRVASPGQQQDEKEK
ncbi:hypothetical protein [Cohaesibacter sp. ES.047]|uniref:hypothetical protein n=1 Tax=Cohaesibacter sp. ES.047 TaxID=1798205 RepID=UPI0012FD0285|nr:hypothetical protein [Cohaesibacter sp. ES.047]